MRRLRLSIRNAGNHLLHHDPRVRDVVEPVPWIPHQATADQASADAAAARQEAAEATATANTALGTAEAAKASADDTEARIDRMFKKAMYK